MRVLLVCFVLLATSTSFSSAFVPASRLGFKPEFLPAGSRSPPRGKETVNFFTRQKLDHFAPEDPRVFSQKYLELLDFFRPRNGPIFLVMCGESTCTGNYVTTYVGTLAESFGAAIVTVEHRYYGHSSPFQHLNLHNLKYLTSKQSLFDHAVFIDYYQDLINQKYNKTEKNPWIVIGGSYAGALSAWFRLKFPHLVAGSWASSAVVEAILDYSAYDKQLGVSVGPKCKQALQEITRLTEQGLVENATEIKYLFGFSPQDNITDDTLLDYVANAAAGEIQYGKIDGLCDPLLKAEKSNRNLLKTYAKILERINNDTNGNERDNESWDFQYCTEVGYFQVASDRKSSVRSSRINTQFFINYCSEQFGNGTFPDVKTTNLYYGGRNIAGSRIMFLNGSQDPWRHASKQTSSKDMPALVLRCHTCSHCVDLSAPCRETTANTTKCRELARAHAFIHSNVKEWLSMKP
ncbi:probable serine protease EDA2 [Selaginella moellendorffii]|uniref:probable serine protease EDA2 n=1 Tax=Selaginella moellendorffii TaxID=88036 RepID=UPI000D1C815D|nr:probable serine protease EDA2 [Selaginella moellendorffii]|eukprot:XP_024537575.1 probable serine protease EDA2 [Selaginella moellendorffii]